MTQHEYVFVAISIILGLAITRLLNNVAALIRAHRAVCFHWSTALWGITVMTYSLQFWWMGWGLRDIEDWVFVDFAVLVAGAVLVYGASEMALPAPDGPDALDFLEHSRGLGRLSALSMLLYFAIGPYVNIVLFGEPVLAALLIPAFGVALLLLMLTVPRFFPVLAVLFSLYTLFIVLITTAG